MASQAPGSGSPRPRFLSATQVRLLLALAALSALVLLAAGWAAERGLRVRERARIERELERDAGLVRELLAGEALVAERREALQEAALRASRAASVRVTVVAPDGTVLADSNVALGDLAGLESHAARPEVREALAGRVGRATRTSLSVGRRLLYLAVPAAEEPGAGAIRVAADLGAIDAESAALRRELAGAGLVVLVCMLPLALLLSHLALRPLREVAEVVHSIAEGDLDRRLPRGAPDEFGRIAAAVNEMAEQLRARLRELTEDKERLQAVLAGMVEGVLVVDGSQRVVLANPRLRELFGFRGSAVGRPHWEVVRRADVQEAIAKAAIQADPIVGDVSTEGPEPRHLQLHAVRFPASGPLLGVVAVFHDVTEVRRLERMRRDFVANVSHELKTPLTAIRGFAETLRGSELPEAQRSAFLDVILRHAERLARLIDDILELSRVEGRQQPFVAADVDVARVAALLLRDLSPQLEARRIGAELAPGARGVAFADRRAVEQILGNLLENASKYTEPGGRIEVRVAEAAGQIRVEVADTGIGIPPEDLPRIFERFYRVDKARSRDLGGTGLGLAIVKHLAQAQGGEVSVRSRPGEGSTFTVLLPRAL
jgi:two-component system, OmpR family, phosphate regulon sensor histidine kinase PhoR